jgi:hypothetical protein
MASSSQAGRALTVKAAAGAAKQQTNSSGPESLSHEPAASPIHAPKTTVNVVDYEVYGLRNEGCDRWAGGDGRTILERSSRGGTDSHKKRLT